MSATRSALPQITQRVRISPLDPGAARELGERLNEAFDPGESAVAWFEDDAGRWTVELNLARPIAGVQLKDVMREAGGLPAAATVTVDSIAPRDWVAASLAGLKPVAVGRFVVHGAHDRGRVPLHRTGIEIEAALAFGTGHHGTTRGCLAALDRLGRSRRPRRVLDLGTGSGVLAIAAARAFHCPVVATDHDRLAVAMARTNAASNRAGRWVRVSLADGVNASAVRAGAPFDLVLANILLQPLRRFARPVRSLLARRATVVLSGLLPGQANAATEIWRAHGLRLERAQILAGWVTLTLRRAG